MDVWPVYTYREEHVMQFVYDGIRAAQAAGYLLNKRGGRLNYTVLIKMLYLADRQALLASGTSITGASPTAMDHGMVLSEVLNEIKIPSDDYWNQHIVREGTYDVRLVATPFDSNHLSQFERGILDRIDAEYGAMDWRQLREVTHRLPEYQDPGGSSIRIDPEVILKAEHVNQKYIDEIGSLNGIERLLKSTRE